MQVRFGSKHTELSGHLVRPPGPPAPRPGLVVCHGFPQVVGGAAFADATLPSLADRLGATQGWTVLSFAFRGCGASIGDFSLGGWFEDLRAAVDLLDALPDVAGVWVAGFGTGGALAVCCAASDARVLGVATLAAPADFDDWAAHPRRLVEYAREVGAISSPGYPADIEAWTNELRLLRAARCAEAFADRALLVVHGSEDAAVPVLDARVLVDAHGGAELRIIGGASHDLRLDPRAVAVLIGWLDRQWTRFQVTQGALGPPIA